MSEEIGKLTNDKLDDYAALTPIIAAGYQGGVKLCAANSNSQEETFKAGSEIGFKWVNGAALDLDVGAWIRIILFDRNGNKVQEETVSGDVVGLGVGSGGIGTSSIVANVDYSGAEIRFHTVLSVSVGMMGVYYGFVREKPDVEHHCDINPTINTNVCEEQTSFQLESNPELSVTWTLGQHPDGSKVSVTPGGYVTNMDIAGDYEFIATAADGCTESVILTLGGFGEIEPCGTPLINLEGQEGRFMLSQDNNDDSEGALLSISNLKNEGNILNGDPDDYATCTSGLGVLTNLNLIGVETVKEGDYIIDGSQYQPGDKIRIGFVVEMETVGLSLDLLTFFEIRTFSDGKSNYRHVIEESDVLSVGLGGSNNHVQKIRFSILVPAYDDERKPRKIDEFMLWREGGINLDISTLNIYYPFIENDPSGSCSDPMGCAIPLSVEMGTTINSNQTQMAGAVDVARVADNLSFLVDNDPNFETAMTVVNSVTVGGGTTIAVKMGHTLDFRHQLVLVTDNKTYTAGIEAGAWLTIETFYRGVATGDKYEKWDVLGANVIGYGDKNFLLVQPQAKYDEVRLTIAGIAGVLDIQSFYGFFLRGDIDGDGLPDCQDPSSCDTEIEGVEYTDLDTLLKESDINISDYTVEARTVNMPSAPRGEMVRSKEYKVVSRHDIRTDDGRRVAYDLQMSEESRGTQNLFFLSPQLKKALDNGYVFCVDELDSSMHPDLLQYLIGLFTSSDTNPHGAQLIVTLHRTEVMTLKLFRRDQILFVDKDNDTGVSELYSLDDFPVRLKEDVRKAYMAGRFGAVPDIV